MTEDKTIVAFSPEDTVAWLRREKETSEGIVDEDTKRKMEWERQNITIAFTAAIALGIDVNETEGVTGLATLLLRALQYSASTRARLQALIQAVEAQEKEQDINALFSAIMELYTFAYGTGDDEVAKHAKKIRDETGVTETEQDLPRQLNQSTQRNAHD